MEIKVFSLESTHFCNEEDLPIEYMFQCMNSKLTNIVLKNRFERSEKLKHLEYEWHSTEDE